MGLLSEFKDFAAKGNVVDLAVGVIIGGAFGKIVSSLVDDIIMPPLGLLVGGVDFTNLKITLKQAAGSAPAVTLNYGNFIQRLFDFTIVAFAIFMMIKALNKMHKNKAAAPAAPTKDQVLLTEIRDLLKTK
jgi:large conductance mechanosensitive channel